MRHHYIKQNQTYHGLSQNNFKRLDQFHSGLDEALRVLPKFCTCRDLSAANTVTSLSKPLVKQAAPFALDASHANSLGISTPLASRLGKGQFVSFCSVFVPEQLVTIKTRLKEMTSVLTSHDASLKDVAVISKDLSKATVYNNTLEALEA